MRELVAANRGERIGKVALFESTNAFDQRVEGLRKRAGNEIDEDATQDDGGEAE